MLSDAVQSSAKGASQTQRADRDLQGQDYSGLSTSRTLQRPPSTDVIHPSKFSIGGSHMGKENLNQLPFLMQDILHKSVGRSTSLPREHLSRSSSNLSSICSESLGFSPSESRNENDAPFDHLGSCSRYKLFGVNLIDRQPELPSPQFAGFSKTSSLLSSPPMCFTSGKTCKKCRSVNNRSCTKVLIISYLTFTLI